MPLFLQSAGMIRDCILSSYLKSGEILTECRLIAESAHTYSGTVLRSLATMQNEGLISSNVAILSQPINPMYIFLGEEPPRNCAP